MKKTQKKKKTTIDVEEQVKEWNLSTVDIRDLVLHVGDHAGAQGHTKYGKLEYAPCCPECTELMRRLFPTKNW